MRPLTRSYLLLLLLGRLFLLVLPFLLGICLRSLRSPPFPLHAPTPAPISVSLAKVQLSLTLTLSSLMIWYSEQTALFLLLWANATPAYLPTAFFVALRLMSWSDGERYLRSLQSLVISLFLSLVPTLLFSRTGGVLYHLNSLTLGFPRFLPRNLCSLVMLVVFSLVYAATDTVFC